MYYPVPEISFKDGLWLTLTFRTSRNYTALKPYINMPPSPFALERAEITQLSNKRIPFHVHVFALERAEITQLSNIQIE